MKILLLGGGGREHALAWKIAQSEKCEKLFIAPGNAGTQNVGENVDIKADDFEALKNFTVENGVDMVVVGPLFHFMPKNGWIFCLILRQQSDFFNNFKNLNAYETFEYTSVCIFHDVRGACLWSGL